MSKTSAEDLECKKYYLNLHPKTLKYHKVRNKLYLLLVHVQMNKTKQESEIRCKRNS